MKDPNSSSYKKAWACFARNDFEKYQTQILNEGIHSTISNMKVSGDPSFLLGLHAILKNVDVPGLQGLLAEKIKETEAKIAEEKARQAAEARIRAADAEAKA